jgi:hypothetical protein
MWTNPKPKQLQESQIYRSEQVSYFNNVWCMQSDNILARLVVQNKTKR